MNYEKKLTGSNRFAGIVHSFCLAAAGYPVRGRVIDRLSREPVAYAAVTITGQPGKGAMTDSLGRFEILQVKPGIL